MIQFLKIFLENVKIKVCNLVRMKRNEVNNHIINNFINQLFHGKLCFSRELRGVAKLSYKANLKLVQT